MRSSDYITVPKYLRDLGERLMGVPVMYGTDQGDTDSLSAIATTFDEMEALIRRVANLNPKAGEIGEGMLTQLVVESTRILDSITDR